MAFVGTDRTPMCSMLAPWVESLEKDLTLQPEITTSWPLCLICHNLSTQTIVEVAYIASLWQIWMPSLHVTFLDALRPGWDRAWYAVWDSPPVIVTLLTQY